MTNIAYLSIGTNMGDRFAHLQDAIKALRANKSIQILHISSIYETEPVGYVDQAHFLNIAVKLQTTLTPKGLLHTCLNIEQKLGRIRKVRWGPRVIDLDILLYNKDNIQTDELIIPHPRMHERAFVLIPLLEIDEHIQLPSTNTPLLKLLKKIPDRKEVRLWRQINGEDASVLFGN
ncbi:2-amino-4-hydroxy-6-hydroxymethyldihydropteridine diphosphokinase [Bacillus chungangensis]|uniref:2-amino-4-hydroxy-6-hydroxymethyldihydropteridine diphosphokinase n=1 Tax=Bacillus chungangensis TaxID=587633 RepID=A0ABT9WX53_9BACI|nr:2-amino-4-hydroxy-6-hydroxymethyldihydropteridine diphosphokinase [Bacillus chungangensis]MDQ0177880.1 2-amino-4-hydroxy-6-hydroxymethyldihydropteridine diphosphokinase [Bacillus chungangensis]